MWFTRVFLTIVVCLHLTLVLGTDLSVVYKHNIYRLNHADTSSPPPAWPLLAKALHFPVGLAYAGTHSSGGDKSQLLLVTDTHSGQASVFGIKFKADQQDAAVEHVIKRYSTSHDFLAYDLVNRALYLSWSSSSPPSASLGVSQLPEDLSSKWAPQPTLLTSVQKGTVRGLAVDPCNRVLYWSEGDVNASAVRWSTLDDDGGEGDTLLQAAPGTHYQGIHYDVHSQSLLVAVTNSSNSSSSSCSFLSLSTLGHPNQTATRSHSSELPPGGVAAGLKVETIATPLGECFPFAVTADERFLYYSDWARQGLMRLDRGAREGNATRLEDTPGVQSQVGWHPGALGVAIIPEKDDEESGKTCGGPDSGSHRIRESINHETSTVASFHENVVAAAPKHEDSSKSGEEYYTDEFENYSYADDTDGVVTASTTKNSETTENTPIKSATIFENNKNEVLLQKDESSGVHGAALPTTANQFRPTQSDFRSSTSATTTQSEEPVEGRNVIGTVASGNVRVSVHSNSSEIYDFTVIGSLSQLSHDQLEKAVVCLSAACCLFFITSLLLVLKLRALRRHSACGSGYSPAEDTVTNPRPAFHCEARGYQNDMPSYDTKRMTESGMCNGSAGVIGSTTDVIIDLSSQDLKCGNSLTSTPSGGAGAAVSRPSQNQYSKNLLARKPMKRFGPSKGGIKCLISKSFVGRSSVGSGGGSCSGLKRSDDDGVLLNIEDCCQMTLCDTPCFSSVQKEGKRYQGGRGLDGDKQGLLDDDDFIPNTDC